MERSQILKPEKKPFKYIMNTDSSSISLAFRHKNLTEREKGIDFSLSTKRADNIMLKSPFPGDRRFQVVDVHEMNFNHPPLRTDVRGHNKRVS